ncbi:MAG: FtsX-like permease family protein [Gemmatimonadetes bacterium]|nr:FtsX-like permease family protein [Gemmatimonadota bacterium]MYB57433.1 FtsX-like permease family protein [Gemmatimonadota bacterium]
MLKNYLTIAIRILFRYKGYSLINISGLAIGMACAALILLYVQDELNFDTHHIKRDRIYRVLRELKSGDNSIFSYRTSGALAPAILQDIPAAEQAIRTFWFKTFVRYEDTLFDLQYCVADPEILNVFTIPFLKGDPATALQGAGTAVLTASAAARIFGRVDPIGKQLQIDGDRDGTIYTITGIISDPPTNSSLHFELLTAHVIPYFFIYWTEWRPMSQYRAIETYILLREKADPVAFQMQLAETMKRYMGDTVAENNAYHLQAMNRMHLYSAQDFGLRDHLSQDAGRPAYGDINQIYLLSIIALIVLVIACVNFINLTTSRAISRATEVGVRKVVGAHRGLLIFQFFFEIMLLTLVGSIIALALIELILPGFNAFVAKDLTLNPQRNPIPYVIGPVVVLIIGIVAGGIPAFYLSSFQPQRRGFRRIVLPL